jgi:hypothetical protein
LTLAVFPWYYCDGEKELSPSQLAGAFYVGTGIHIPVFFYVFFAALLATFF